MKTEIKNNLIQVVNQAQSKEDKYTAACHYIASVIESAIQPAYDKIIDAYETAFGRDTVQLNSFDVKEATVTLNGTGIKYMRRMSYTANDVLSDNASVLISTVNSISSLNEDDSEMDADGNPTEIAYLNQAITLINNTAQFVDEADDIVTELIEN